MERTRFVFPFACVAIAFIASSALGGYTNSGSSEDFSFFPTPTAWNPGVNTARVGGFPSPGGATWSVMAAGVADSTADNHGPGGAGADFTTALAALYAGGVDEVTTIGLALDKWAAVSLFTNLGQVADGGAAFGATEAAGGHLGDIRVGAIFIDGAIGPNVLAHAYQPGTQAIFGAGGTVTGDAHFDNGNAWSDGGGAGTFDFHTVALHEFGHSLGLGHSLVVGSVMEAVYAGPRRTLGPDDIAGIQAIYGAAIVPEPVSIVYSFTGGLCLLAFSRRR